jgi:hypothetical protein|tara:strand:- start:3 stop:263 length:261 start_codon:yes stop_codon:yes gene_type:complete
MLDQTLLNWLIFTLGAIMSAILHTIWGAVKDLRAEDKAISQKLASIQILVAGDYIRKQEFDRVIDRLFVKLDSIEASLVSKQDKET